MLLVKFVERHMIIVSSSPFFRQKKRHRQFIKVINFLRLLVEATSDFISLSEYALTRGTNQSSKQMHVTSASCGKMVGKRSATKAVLHDIEI